MPHRAEIDRSRRRRLALAFACPLALGLVVGIVSVIAGSPPPSAVALGEASRASDAAARAKAGPQSAPDTFAAFDPVRTAYIVTAGAGGDLPGCGAISAVDVESGEVLYSSEYLGSRDGISAAEDFSAFASGPGAGSSRLYFLDARAEDPGSWRARELWSPRGPRRISGDATAILDGDLWFGASGPGQEGRVIGRVPLPWIEGEPDLRDVNPLQGAYSIGGDAPAQILPDPDGRRVHVLAYDYRLPETVDEVIDEHALRLHILDRQDLVAREAAIPLPPLIVDEPPGAGLRAAGVHNWPQNGRLAYATLLTAEPWARGPQSKFLVVNRWLRPELTIVDLNLRTSRYPTVVSATLPADFAFAGAVAASRGPDNLGLLAVHGGDKIGLFQVDPRAAEVALEELARVSITPVISPLSDDQRMMSGPIAWSADGSSLLVAGNEGDAELLVYSVEGCGRELRLEHVIAACSSEHNHLAGIVTAQGSRVVPPTPVTACARPGWLGEPWDYDTQYLLSLPRLGR